MKQIRYSILILVLLISSWAAAESTMMSANPAGLKYNLGWELELPILSYDLDLDNSLFNLNNMDLFDKSRYENGQVMSDSDKEIFTREDLTVNGSFSTTMIGLKYRNFGWKVTAHGSVYAPLLDRKYAEIALYGNDTNRIYNFHSGKDSRGFVFLKSSLSYAIPREFKLAEIFKSESGSGLMQAPFTLGFNLNLYYPGYYAEMVESSQQFGTMVDSLFYNYNARFYYYDEDSEGKIGLGVGFGLMSRFERGKLSLQVDDIFAALYLENLAGGEYSGTYSDYLLYFHSDDYEPFDESLENDSLRVDKHKAKLSPAVFIGVEYDLYRGITGRLHYQNSDYIYPDGLSVGAEYMIIDLIPVAVTLGKAQNVYYQFATGLEFEKVSFGLAFTTYHGFFQHARGLGLESYLKVRF